MTDREAKLARSRYRNMVKANDPERSGVEEWMKKMGTQFVDVQFFIRRTGEWVTESHVEDHETFLATIEMAASRMNAANAMWHDGEMWCVLNFRSGDTRRLPTKEAAEMVAIHVR